MAGESLARLGACGCQRANAVAVAASLLVMVMVPISLAASRLDQLPHFQRDPVASSVVFVGLGVCG